MSSLDKFRDRLKKLHETWKKGSSPGFANTQAVLVATGEYDADEDIGYLKSFALITWLFGAELQGAAVVFSASEVLLAFAKADYSGLSGLSGKPADGLPKITVVSTEDERALDEAVKRAIGDVKHVAVLTKEIDSQEGKTATVVKKIAKSLHPVNVSPGLAMVLAIKDEEEEKRVKKAAFLSAHVMKYSLTDRVEKTIDQERRTSHTSLSEHAEYAIMNPTKAKLGALKADLCDPCYPPIIQSAGPEAPNRTFDLRPSAESSDEHLAFGCIVASIGARFNFYCSNISRTLFISPTKVQGAVYETVLAAQEAAIRSLLPGKPLKAAYAAAVKSLKSGCESKKAEGIDMPDLVAALTKNVGFGMGIEFRDSSCVLNQKNEAKVEEKMIFNVSVGVQNIKDKDNGTYSVLIGDTVLIRGTKMGPDVFTSASRKDFKHISYQIETGGEDEEDADMGKSKDRRKGKASRSNGHAEEIDLTQDKGRRRRGALDTAHMAETLEEEARRKKHQEALAKKMLDIGRSRLQGGNILTMDDIKVAQKKLLDEFRAYNTPADFPSVKPRAIVVDMESEAIIVPVNGIPVPFHISTLKNATKSDEGQYSYLRVNFHTPQAVARGPRPGNAPRFPGFAVREGTSAAFIKEFTFRSSNPINLNDCLRKIKELRKRVNEKATHALQKETLVTQQSLVIERRSLATISEVSIRPPMAKGKHNVGILEAHTNGFRYRCRSGSVEIIYSNIRNAFFQEADRELLVLVHFHLKNEIMVGNKKAKDVQFYVQVMEAVVKLNENRRRQFDQDELEEEQRERELRNRTNKNFLKFTKEVEERYGLEFDFPYRQLQFTGAPKSVAVTLLPTVSCIVNLTEWPPFVLNLEDVEVAHFERVIFQLRMFDVVFIMKGFEDDPAATGKAAKDLWLRISSIPMEELTPLKRYLDEQNLKYYEGKASLQWNEVLKNIRVDLLEFYENGGWNFLSLEGPDEDGGDGSQDDGGSLDGDVEFAPSFSDDAYESDDESSDADSDSDASDAVRELEGDSDEGEDDLSSDEEGMDWDELERQAQTDDMRKGRGSDDDDRRRPRGRRGDDRRRSSGRSGGRNSGGRKPPPASRKRGRRNR